MTNEEKINEIAEKEVHPIIAERCAREMAEWKDNQFKEYLEKLREKYITRREMWQQDTFEYCCYDSQIDTIDKIINELFGEE